MFRSDRTSELHSARLPNYLMLKQMTYPLSSVEANIRAFIDSVKQGSASANPSPLEDAVISRKPTKRSEYCVLRQTMILMETAPGIVNVKLATTNCHSIELLNL